MITKNRSGTFTVSRLNYLKERITLSNILSLKEAEDLENELKNYWLDSVKVLQHLVTQRPLKYISRRCEGSGDRWRVIYKKECIDTTFSNLKDAIAFRDEMIPNKYKKLLDEKLKTC